MADMKKQIRMVEKLKGTISDGERQFLRDMLPRIMSFKGAISEAEMRNLIDTMGGQPIRGMNSERRKELLKPSKFRR